MITIVKKVGEYQRPSGAVFVYSIKGEKEEMAQYKKTLGDNYREDNGVVLFYSRTPVSAGEELTLRSDATGYFVKQDLEAKTVRQQSAKENWEAKIQAMQSVLGLSKEEILKAVLAA